MLFFNLLGIFFIIMVLLEINFTGEVESPQINVHKTIFKHFSGFLFLLFYFLYAHSWGEYHLGHYHHTIVKKFRLFPALDTGDNYIATLAIFYFIYSGLFLVLNKFVLNKEL